VQRKTRLCCVMMPTSMLRKGCWDNAENLIRLCTIRLTSGHNNLGTNLSAREMKRGLIVVILKGIWSNTV
jgi:hypothetical protein